MCQRHASPKVRWRCSKHLAPACRHVRKPCSMRPILQSSMPTQTLPRRTCRPCPARNCASVAVCSSHALFGQPTNVTKTMDSAGLRISSASAEAQQWCSSSMPRTLAGYLIRTSVSSLQHLLLCEQSAILSKHSNHLSNQHNWRLYDALRAEPLLPNPARPPSGTYKQWRTISLA